MSIASMGRWAIGPGLRRVHRAVAWSFIAAILAGCGSSAASPKPTVPSYSATQPVIVEHEGGNPDALYLPDPIKVRIGQEVTWTNDDGDPHDVTAYSGAFASGPIPSGGSWRWIATRPGTYRYFCTVHPEMHGTIIVRS